MREPEEQRNNKPASNKVFRRKAIALSGGAPLYLRRPAVELREVADAVPRSATFYIAPKHAFSLSFARGARARQESQPCVGVRVYLRAYVRAPRREGTGTISIAGPLRLIDLLFDVARVIHEYVSLARVRRSR